MEAFQLPLAFFLGLLSVATPCVLPLIPSYLAYLCGNERYDLLRGSLAIFLGVALGAMGVGLVLSLLGDVTASRWFYIVAALMVAILLADALVFKRIKPVVVGKGLLARKGLLACFLYGLLIIFVASPCILPLLAITAVVTLSFAEGAWRLLVMSSYALGLSLPFILVAAFSSRLGGLNRFAASRYSHWLTVALLGATLVWLLWYSLTL